MLIKSLISIEDTIHSTTEILEWLRRHSQNANASVERISLKDLKLWRFDSSGTLAHNTGRFFSIEGIEVRTDYGPKYLWHQPIINQSEVGYLGILTKEINGILYFLMQAKIEPGNINSVQISPTLQATKSNYSQVHRGNSPNYLNYFVNAKKEEILLDQLQSEQGARFLRKRNRNIIIKVEGDVEVLENFRWMTLGQIKQLMQYDNLVNMDTRTVISGLNISECITPLTDLSKFSQIGRDLILSSLSNYSLFSDKDILSWLTHLKSKYDLRVFSYPINKMSDWLVTNDEIVHHQEKYFKVIGVDVKIANREVVNWTQPLIQPQQEGICAFLIKKIDNVYHFLVQAKLECGNFDIMELAPTVQCLTGKVPNDARHPAFYDIALDNNYGVIITDTLQSEEGGRFYHEQNRNIVKEVDSDFPLEVPENYKWMTLQQIHLFLRFNNYLNIQARSLLSLINYV